MVTVEAYQKMINQVSEYMKELATECQVLVYVRDGFRNTQGENDNLYISMNKRMDEMQNEFLQAYQLADAVQRLLEAQLRQLT